MKLLPYHRFELISRLRPAEAISAIANVIEEPKFFRMAWPSSKNDKRFAGSAGGDTFSVRRILGYRNSFMPVVEGAVQAHGGGSRIVITMRPFIFVMVFCAIWCAGVSTAFSTSAWPLGIAMLAFLYAMVMGGFWFEASKQERVLREIFQAEAAETGTPLVS